MKRPSIELSECIRCGICVEVSPAVFSINQSGYVMIADLDRYPESDVDEAIKYCPADCIFWND